MNQREDDFICTLRGVAATSNYLPVSAAQSQHLAVIQLHCSQTLVGAANKVPVPLQVAHRAHNAWQNLPDPATLDASSLNLPRIMGPILSAATPNATHLYSKLLVVHAPATGAPALPAAWLLSKLRKRWDHDARPQLKNTGAL